MGTEGWRLPSAQERLEFRAFTALALGLGALAIAVTLSGPGGGLIWLDALARAVMVAAPILVGSYARRRTPAPGAGTLLIAVGAAWFVTTLAGSDNELLYSVGRVAGWPVEVGIVYLVLSYPTGRLQGRFDRTLIWSFVGVVALLYLPTALLVDQYPLPSPTTTCQDGCPGNAFMVLSSEPGFVDDIVRPLREVLSVVLFAAAVVRLTQRLRSATPLGRTTVEPFLAFAIARVGLLAVAFPARALDPDSDLVIVLSELIALALPAMALAFLVGITRWRLFIAGGMERLATGLQGHPGPAQLRAALRDAFDDPSLEIRYWLDAPHRWADEHGVVVETPRETPRRALTEVRDGERPIALLLHDPALRDDQTFVNAATSFALMILENQSLTAETTALLREARTSRARIQRSADDERRRIERDLHDGAQQRLVALRIKLGLAAERMDGSRGGDLLRSMGDEVEATLDEVRSLARGIFPAPLADRGLVEALRAAALDSPLPTTVLAAGVRNRYAPEIESAAYFCCLEALHNAARHAEGARAVVIELSDNGALRFAVRDDGGGFDPETVERGVGMASMADRVAAVGGRFDIDSGPGRGTRVSGVIELNGQD